MIPICKWRVADLEGDYWQGECGALILLAADMPNENGFDFCPKCRGKIMVVDKLSAV